MVAMGNKWFRSMVDNNSNQNMVGESQACKTWGYALFLQSMYECLVQFVCFHLGIIAFVGLSTDGVLAGIGRNDILAFELVGVRP